MEIKCNSEWKFEKLNDGTIRILDYLGSNSRVNIPSQIAGATVKEIGERAFWGNGSVEEVYVPEGVTALQNSAFGFCCELHTIRLPDTLEIIGTEVLSLCGKLERVIIPPNVSKIGECAFAMCEKLNHVEVSPENQRYSIEDKMVIGTSKFAFGKEIVLCPKSIEGDVIIPEGVVSIANYAFADCSKIKSVCLPKGFQHIGEYAFSSCTELGNITLPDTLFSIGALAFDGCAKLKSVSLPEKCRFGSGQFSPFGENTDINIHIVKPCDINSEYKSIWDNEFYDSWDTILSGFISTMPATVKFYVEKIKILNINGNYMQVLAPIELSHVPIQKLKAYLGYEIYRATDKHIEVQFVFR